MGLLTKIRGLYRFDGDTEPVQVSRRAFLFVGGVVAAGAAIPWPAGQKLIAAGDLFDYGQHLGDVQVLFRERYREVVPALFESYDAPWNSFATCKDLSPRALRISRQRHWSGQPWIPTGRRGDA